MASDSELDDIKHASARLVTGIVAMFAAVLFGAIKGVTLFVLLRWTAWPLDFMSCYAIGVIVTWLEFNLDMRRRTESTMDRLRKAAGGMVH